MYAEPGIDVYLNDELKGTTSKEYNGLLLQDIPVGDYTFKAVSNIEGTIPEIQKIHIAPDKICAISIQIPSPKFEIHEYRGTQNSKGIYYK